MSWSIEAIIAFVTLMLTICVPFLVYVWRRFRSQRQAERAQPDVELGNLSESPRPLTPLPPVLLRRDTDSQYMVDTLAPWYGRPNEPQNYRTHTISNDCSDTPAPRSHDHLYPEGRSGMDLGHRLPDAGEHLP
ncbi:hypothetical protein Ptr902_10664 [Pyrenophora tritici-repentis]|nr:hypothetical protein Ptr902_10664 [Pyrenophora tritici-repentis]